MNYTKGEWKLRDTAPGTLWHIVALEPPTLIAECSYLPNAHLIAAAPMMYEALKEVEGYFNINPEIAEEFPRFVGLTQQALSKAEGREV